jgi:hypothetical protein
MPDRVSVGCFISAPRAPNLAVARIIPECIVKRGASRTSPVPAQRKRLCLFFCGSSAGFARGTRTRGGRRRGCVAAYSIRGKASLRVPRVRARAGPVQALNKLAAAERHVAPLLWASKCLALAAAYFRFSARLDIGTESAASGERLRRIDALAITI